MSQEEVYEALKKSKKPLTSKEIAQLINIGMRSVRHSLKVLKECSEVEFKKLTEQQRFKKYGRNINPPKIGVYFIKKV